MSKYQGVTRSKKLTKESCLLKITELQAAWQASSSQEQKRKLKNMISWYRSKMNKLGDGLDPTPIVVEESSDDDSDSDGVAVENNRILQVWLNRRVS